MTGIDILDATNFVRITSGIIDVRANARDRHNRWRRRVPRVDTTRGELLLRADNRILMADMIWYDSEARIVEEGRLMPYGGDVPKFKLGRGYTEEQLELWDRISARAAGRDDTGTFANWTGQAAERNLIGIEAMQNFICLAMMLDRGLTYDGPGIKINALNFGTPSYLKTTSATPWQANPSTADPLAEISSIRVQAEETNGVRFDRLEMSSAAFRVMIACTKYQVQAQATLPPQITNFAAQLNPLDLENMRQIASRVLGLNIVLVNDRYDWQGTNGAVVQSPYLPDRYIMLSNSADDGDRGAWDFGVVVVPETRLLRQFPGSVPGGSAIAGRRGPVSFATLPNPELNPPGLNIWGVDAGFPRKHRVTSCASIDIGPVTPLYSPVDPFATS